MFSNKSLIDKVSGLVLFIQIMVLALTITSLSGKISSEILPERLLS